MKSSWRICSCGEKTTKEIPALGHDSKSIDGIEPTCTQPGKEANKIYNETFKDCTSLERINYNGTKADWNKIDFAEKWNYGMTDLTVVCSDGELVITSIN